MVGADVGGVCFVGDSVGWFPNALGKLGLAGDICWPEVEFIST